MLTVLSFSGIVNYMIMQQGEASKLKLSVKDVKSSMKQDEIYVMGFFDNLNDPKLRMYMDAGMWRVGSGWFCPHAEKNLN